MKKRILLIGYNFYPEPTGIGKYSGEMMDWLAAQGHECAVVTAYPYYPYWQVQEPYHQHRFQYQTEEKTFPSGGSLTVYRCPMYVPAKPSGLKRMLVDFSFLLSAALRLGPLAIRRRYDAVLVVAPSFLFGLLGVAYKKLRGGKFLYHIQDMQIEAARDLRMIKSKGVIKLLFGLERYIFRQADTVSSISEGMVARIAAKAGKEIVLFPNWADTAVFFPLENRAALKTEYGFNSSNKIILYSGGIGEKQGLEAILHAAQKFRMQPEIKFVICGSGPYKQTLEQMAQQLKLQNVVFLPLQPHEKFNQFLNMADVHLVIQKANASDLVMPSKLTTILAVGGLALITANADSGLHELVSQHNMGILVAAENQSALDEGIHQAVTAHNSHLTANARAYAQSYLSINGVMQKFMHASLGGYAKNH